VKSRTSRLLRRRVLGHALCGIALLLIGAGPSLAQDPHKQVLVLYSTRTNNQFSIIGEHELPRILDVGPKTDLDYYSEFIDLSRFRDPSHPILIANFFRQKYRDTRFDVVIAMQDVAVQFLKENRESLFPDTPVVYLANDRRNASFGPNSTGLIQERKFTGTVALIEKLQPDARNVFVIAGAAPGDKAYEDAMRSQMQSFNSRLTVNYLSGLATDELERQLARLPEHSAVYYLRVTEDGAGNKYHPLEYIDRVAAAANAPTYCWVDSALDHGIVGGSLYSQLEAIRRLASTLDQRDGFTIEGAQSVGTMKILGIALIAGGLLALVYGGFTYTKDTHEAKIGPLVLSVTEKQTVNVPIWAGIGAIVIGGLLLVFGNKRT